MKTLSEGTNEESDAVAAKRMERQLSKEWDIWYLPGIASADLKMMLESVAEGSDKHKSLFLETTFKRGEDDIFFAVKRKQKQRSA